MTTNITRKIQEQDNRLRSAEIAVVEFARSLVFSLQDAGKNASAKELERLLFTLDAEKQACTEFIKANMEAIFLEIGRNPPSK